MPIRPPGGSTSAPVESAAPATGGSFGRLAATASAQQGRRQVNQGTNALGLSPAVIRRAVANPTYGRFPGPLNTAIRLASTPAFVIGNAIRDPSTLLPNNKASYLFPPALLADAAVESYRKKDSVLPGQALRQRGALNFIPKAYGARSIAAFGLDLALDPLSYATFGGGAAVSAGGKSLAKGAAIRGIEAAIAAEKPVTVKMVAQAAAADVAERMAIPNTAKISFRVPFSRAKDIPLWQSAAVPKATAKAKAKLPSAPAGTSKIIDAIHTGGRRSEIVKAVHQETRRFTSQLEVFNVNAAKQLDDFIAKEAKTAGLDVKAANKEIALHLDNPGQYAVRPELQNAVDAAKAFRDDITAADVQAGMFDSMDDLVANYFPHMADSGSGERAVARFRQRRSLDKQFDPFFTKEREARNLDEFAQAGQHPDHAFTPEYNVAKALEARGRASIRARQLRAINETLIDAVGVKSPPRSTAKEAARLEEAKIGAAEAVERLEALTAPRPTAALQREAQAAREAVSAARSALAAARRTGNISAVRAATWRLQVAERKAAGQVAYAARVQAATAVPRFRELMASAEATGARLPKPRAGTYEVDVPLKKLSSRLRRFARSARKDARELRDSVKDDLRKESRFRKSRGTGPKTLDDYEQDYLAEMAWVVDNRGVQHLPAQDRKVYEAVEQAQELDNLADEIEAAFVHSEGGAFGELDKAAGLQRLDELATSLVGKTEKTNLRAKRARRSEPPVARGNEALTERGAEQMQRYFGGPETTMLDEAAQVQKEATREIERAIKKADRRVSAAKRDLARAQRASDATTVKNARAALVRAQATARASRLALERARAGAVGTPREIVAQTKRVVKREAAVAKAERKLGAVEQANLLIQRRPGKPSTAEEWRELRKEWSMLEDGTKYSKGTLLPPSIAEELREVHALVSPILNDSAIRVMERFLGGFTSRWKVLALLNPGYHVRNQIDDGIRAFMAGARNPYSYTQAARILKGGTEGAGKQTIRIGKKTYTHDQYLARARAYGVIDSGFVRSETISSGEMRMSDTFLGMRSPGKGRLARLSSDVGNYRENVNRLALFMELEKGGRSPLVAARRTREFLIDYGEVGKFVNSARQFVFPFITYPSKVIPLMGRQLVQRPGTFSHLGAAIGASNQAAGNPDLTNLQTYNRSAFGVPLPDFIRRQIGVADGEVALVNPGGLLGFGSLDMLDPRLKPATSTFAGGLLNPLARVPVEIMTGKNLFFGTNLSRLATAPNFIKKAADLGIPIPTYVPPEGTADEKGKTDYAGRPVPGYSSYLNQILGMVPIVNQATRATNPDENARRNSLAKLLFGIPVSAYDEEVQRGYAAKSQR